MKRRVIYKESPDLANVLDQLKKEKGFTFNPDQCGAINYGLGNKVDVLRYADPAYSGAHMIEIFKTLSEGLDVRLLQNPELTAEKARELRLGLEAGLDVTILADPALPLTNLQWLRRAMTKGIDITAYPEFQGSISKIIKKYNQLCNKEEKPKSKRCTLRVMKVQEEICEMVVEYDDPKQLKQAIHQINGQKLDKVQRIKDKLYEMDIVAPEKRTMVPMEREIYFEIVDH